MADLGELTNCLGGARLGRVSSQLTLTGFCPRNLSHAHLSVVGTGVGIEVELAVGLHRSCTTPRLTWTTVTLMHLIVKSPEHC